MRSGLWVPAFGWFAAGQGVSLLGSALAPVALAFAVLGAAGRPTDLGVVLAARMLPLLALLLLGGAVADRLPRRGVLVVANLGSALTQGAVAAVLLGDRYTLGAVAALELANGALTAFTTPALSGVLPELVGAQGLRQANAVLALLRNGSKVLGPSISGLLVVAVGGGVAIAVDAVSFLVAACCLARLPAGTVPARRTRVFADIREGWATFRTTRWLWVVTAAFGVVNLVQTGTWQILGPALTRPALWGFVLSARAVGLLLAAALMYRVTPRYLLRFGLCAGVLGALPFLALGAGAPVGWLVAAAFTGGLGSSVLLVGWTTTLGEHVPAGSLSRASSYDSLLSYLAIPAGQLGVGPLAAVCGAAPVMLGAGVAYAAAAAAPLGSAAVRGLAHRR